MPHPNAHRRFTFIIDANDCIEQTHRHWDEFALENGGESLPGLVVGKPLLDFICGVGVRQATERILSAVRADGVTRHFPFRCDSANVIRRMEMEVSLLPESRLRLQSRIIRLETRPSVTLIQVSDACDPAGLSLCPNCRLARLGDAWIEETEAVAVGAKPFAYPALCPTCSDLMEGVAFHQAA